MDSYETEMLIKAEQETAQTLRDLIGLKCREHCGMRRAWSDGLCHATEQMCCLAPNSPIWAGRASLARPEEKVAQAPTADWDDL